MRDAAGGIDMCVCVKQKALFAKLVYSPYVCDAPKAPKHDSVGAAPRSGEGLSPLSLLLGAHRRVPAPRPAGSRVLCQRRRRTHDRLDHAGDGARRDGRGEGGGGGCAGWCSASYWADACCRAAPACARSRRSERNLGWPIWGGGGRLSCVARARGDRCVSAKPPPVRKVGIHSEPAACIW